MLPPAETATPEPLVTATDATTAIRDEATRLLAALAEMSSRQSIGAIRPAERAALADCAADVEPDLLHTALTLREIHKRLRLAAGLRRSA